MLVLDKSGDVNRKNEARHFLHFNSLQNNYGIPFKFVGSAESVSNPEIHDDLKLLEDELTNYKDDEGKPVIIVSKSFDDLIFNAEPGDILDRFQQTGADILFPNRNQ